MALRPHFGHWPPVSLKRVDPASHIMLSTPMASRRRMPMASSWKLSTTRGEQVGRPGQLENQTFRPLTRPTPGRRQGARQLDSGQSVRLARRPAQARREQVAVLGIPQEGGVRYHRFRKARPLDGIDASVVSRKMSVDGEMTAVGTSCDSCNPIE
jgi:hypothetical protein